MAAEVFFVLALEGVAGCTQPFCKNLRISARAVHHGLPRLHCAPALTRYWCSVIRDRPKSLATTEGRSPLSSRFTSDATASAPSVAGRSLYTHRFFASAMPSRRRSRMSCRSNSAMAPMTLCSKFAMGESGRHSRGRLFRALARARVKSERLPPFQVPVLEWEDLGATNVNSSTSTDDRLTATAVASTQRRQD